VADEPGPLAPALTAPDVADAARMDAPDLAIEAIEGRVADTASARAILDYLEQRYSDDAMRRRHPRPPRWLSAVEAVHSAARHPLSFLVDGLALAATGLLVGVTPPAAALVAALVVLVASYVGRVYADRDTVTSQGVLWYPGRLVLPLALIAYLAMVTGLVADPTALLFVPTAITVLTFVRAVTWSILGLARRRGVGLRRTLIVGSGRTAETVVRRLGEFPEAGLLPAVTRPLSLLRAVETMFDEIREHGVEHVVLVIDPADEVSVIDSLRRCQGIDTFFSMVPPLADLFLRPGSVSDVGGVPLVPLGRVLRGRTAFPGKRVLDVFGATMMLILFSPLMALTALAIRLDDGGPVFYRQRRVGRDGELFEMCKFRSMFVGADSMRAELAGSNVTDGLLFKVALDPRITRVGSVIRRTSIDELPQLWNVLRGDMSLVGPRPLPVEPESFGSLDAQRHAARPGITGYWQVSGGNGLTYREMIKLDLAYLHNWSIWLDIRLLFRTIPALLNRKGPA